MKFIFLFVMIFVMGPAFAQMPGEMQRPDQNSISSLKFLGEYTIPFRTLFDSTVVGGLSGIDYNATENVFYILSDDRGSIGNIRFYTARITIDTSGIRAVEMQTVTSLEDEGGNVYNKGRSPQPDPESIRIDPRRKLVFWSSEGERAISNKKSILYDPFIHVSDYNGNFVGAFSLPENLKMSETESGPRQNSVLEGLAFDRDFNNLYVALEEPLYEDGPRADIVPNGATTRIYRFNTSTRKCTAQFAYGLEPIAFPPFQPDKFKINGISEFAYTGSEELFLVVERSFSMGRLPCTIKVFLTDLSQAENIEGISSLNSRRQTKAATKKLLLNMDDLGIYIDNIEGVTFGPLLENGHRTLVFVSDDNFRIFQKTQFLLFEVVP